MEISKTSQQSPIWLVLLTVECSCSGIHKICSTSHLRWAGFGKAPGTSGRRKAVPFAKNRHRVSARRARTPTQIQLHLQKSAPTDERFVACARSTPPYASCTPQLRVLLLGRPQSERTPGVRSKNVDLARLFSEYMRQEPFSKSSVRPEYALKPLGPECPQGGT